MEETGDADNLTLLVTTNDTFRVNDTCPYSDSDSPCLNDTWISDTNDTCVTPDNVTSACLNDGEESDYLYKVRSLKRGIHVASDVAFCVFFVLRDGVEHLEENVFGSKQSEYLCKQIF